MACIHTHTLPWQALPWCHDCFVTSFMVTELSPKPLPKALLPGGKEGRRGFGEKPFSGVRGKKKEKKTKIWDPSSGHPVGGLLSPSLTPTHQYCPSCPAGRTPLAGYSDRAAGQVAGRGLAGRPPTTPLLLSPGLNLSLQTAWPESHAARRASFKSLLVESPQDRADAPRRPHPITNRPFGPRFRPRAWASACLPSSKACDAKWRNDVGRRALRMFKASRYYRFSVCR